jgi:hypothetical protein
MDNKMKGFFEAEAKIEVEVEIKVIKKNRNIQICKFS